MSAADSRVTDPVSGAWRQYCLAHANFRQMCRTACSSSVSQRTGGISIRFRGATPPERHSTAPHARDNEGITVRNQRLQNRAATIVRRRAPMLWVGLLCAATPAGAQAPPVPVTVGAGVQTSFVDTETDGSDRTGNFLLNSVRLYVSGRAADRINFMFNTEYDGSGNHVTVLDAAAQFEMSDHFHVWVGRFLPPSDRANLYGPYYAHHWSTFTDGVQDGYPFVSAGRANGAVYWGQFGKVKVSAGGFDGASATSSPTLIGAGRIQVDFWNPEDGYYLNGTYYGDK